MARRPTTYSRLSTGYKDSKTSIGSSNYDFSCIDGYAETLTLGGGTSLEKISVTTHSVDFGSVTSLVASSVKTIGIAGAADGDLLLAMHPSLWSGAYEALTVRATSGDTAGEVNLYVTNSGITAIDSAAAIVNVLHIDF